MNLAIDLYCGLGGWTDGLLAEGWEMYGKREREGMRDEPHVENDRG